MRDRRDVGASRRTRRPRHRCDIADETVAVAAEAVPEATFVTGDVHDLPVSLRKGTFDLVLTEGGVLVWLHDLDGWAAGVERRLIGPCPVMIRA